MMAPTSMRARPASFRPEVLIDVSRRALITLLGGAAASSLWPLLALLLLGWRDRLSAERVMERAAWLGTENEVERGLAIVAYLFPELQEWTADIPFRMPLWERTLAVPIAARKLAVLTKMEGSTTEGSVPVSSSELLGQTGRQVRWGVTGASRRGSSHPDNGRRAARCRQEEVS